MDPFLRNFCRTRPFLMNQLECHATPTPNRLYLSVWASCGDGQQLALHTGVPWRANGRVGARDLPHSFRIFLFGAPYTVALTTSDV
jgi:hypothetical protein